MTVIAVVPARSGSKGVPRKNVRELDGKPLLAHQVENALEADTIDRTIVSTDDSEFAAIGRDYGAEVPFTRPDYLATDDVPVIAVYEHAVEHFTERDDRPSHVVGLQPTCPFTDPGMIDAAVKKARETGCDAVASVAEVIEPHPYNTYHLDGDRLEPFEGVTVEEPIQRQDRPDVYSFTGAIFVRTSAVLEAWDGEDYALGTDTRVVEQSERERLDIDTPFDLKVARALAQYDADSVGDTVDP